MKNLTSQNVVKKLAFIFGVVAIIGGSIHGRVDAAPKRPNVLLIYVDDMGYNDLACYGAENPGIKTPNIDRLAAEGVRFTDYLSACSVCAPSRAAVLTGRYPQRNGNPVCDNGKPELADWYNHVGMPSSEITIAEFLKPLGYATAAFGKWHLGSLEKFAPWNQGFEKYVGSKHNFPIGLPNMWWHDDQQQGEIMYQEAHQKLTDATINFMKQQHEAEKPFFIYLAHYLVHGPWAPNKEFCTPEEWVKVKNHKKGMLPEVLPAMVRELDYHVGLVMESIKELGIDEETLVVFASDNGPWLPAGSAAPLAGGKYTTMEGGHRVPAMVRWPGTIPGGRVSDEMVSALDILPTIAAVVEEPLPDDRTFDGYDLMPLLSGKSKRSPRRDFAYYNGLTLEAVRTGPWKLHLPREKANRVYWAGSKFDPYLNLDSYVLNNLEDDLGEKVDLASQSSQKTLELKEMAQRIRYELGDWNMDGVDRPKFTYPGDLNIPNFIKERRKPKPKPAKK